MRCILIIILIFITYSFQIVKGNEYVPQMVDKESAIIIRTDKKTYFSVQLFCRFTEEGFYTLIPQHYSLTLFISA